MDLKASELLIEKLTRQLREKYNCHTVILYGSYGRGDACENSDIDMMGVMATGEKFRDAWVETGTYVDLFLWPQKALEPPTANHIYMVDGIVLWEEKDWGSIFLSKLKEIYQTGPEPLPEYEKKVRRLWMKKMLNRARVGDLEGTYRRAWLQTSLLEEYFALREKWFLGSRRAFSLLSENDKNTFDLFNQTLHHPDDLTVLENLVESVSGES